MTTKTKPATPDKAKIKEKDEDLAKTYNAFKEFEGRRYTGAKVGRRQKWYYDQGEWRERKLSPDEWEIDYNVTKRRAGHAPKGSGVPVGTEYHWYILAHQIVRKINADDYTTAMTGAKFKLAHKRANKDKWSATDNAQKRKLIGILEDMIEELKAESSEPRHEEKPEPDRENDASGKPVDDEKGPAVDGRGPGIKESSDRRAVPLDSRSGARGKKAA